MFGVFNLCMLIHVALLFPETSGKTLEDVAKMFEDPDGIPYIGTAPWKTKVEYQSMARMEKGDVPPGKLDSIADEGHESPNEKA